MQRHHVHDGVSGSPTSDFRPRWSAPALLLVCLLAYSPVSADTYPSSFTLRDNGWTYTEQNFGTRWFGTASGRGDYKCQVDHMFQNWWWYCAEIYEIPARREYALSNLTAFAQGSPNTVRLRFHEPVIVGFKYPRRRRGRRIAFKELLEIDLKYELHGSSCKPDAAQVRIDWQVTNLSLAHTVEFNLFAYTDYDLTGTPADDSIIKVTPSHLRQFDRQTVAELKASTGRLVEFDIGKGSLGPLGMSKVGPMALLPKLCNLSRNDYDSLPEALSGDVHGGFQWRFSLLPSATESGYLIKEITPEPAVPALLAVGALALIRRRARAGR